MRFFCALLLLLGIALYAEEMTTVEADEAHYDGSNLKLRGHIVVIHPLGRLIAEQAVLRKGEEGKSKIDFPWLHLSEDVVITFASGGFLKCQKLDIDYDASLATLEGPPQLYYKDKIGELFADRAFIDYQEKDGKVEPTKVTLRGNVQMIGNSKTEKPTLQYALADIVEYFPQEERMILKGEEGRTVLFYDRLKEMQLSAKTVYAARMPDGRESVQGTGDVRLVFKQDELEKLKQRFKWESHE